MANHVLNQRSWELFQRMARDYQAGRLKNRPQVDPTPTSGGGGELEVKIGRVKANEDIEEGVYPGIKSETSGSVRVANEDWSSLASKNEVIEDVWNDTSIDLDPDTKVYIAKIAKRWRIIWGRVC